MVRAGLLNKIISFKKPIISVNEFGEEVTSFETVITTRARVVFKNENRELTNNENVYTTSLTFTIRSYHEIDQNMIILYNNKNFRIISLDDTISGEIKIETEQIND